MTANSTKSMLWGLVGGLLALTLTACGGDTPEAVRSALGDAAPTLAYIEEPESSCVADAILEMIGFEELAVDGHTSETLTTDPESIATILEGHDSKVVRAALLPCFDTDELVQQQLVQLNGDEPLACTAPDDVPTALVDQAVDRHFESDDRALDIDDDDEQRDLLRPCLDEATFASLFDIDLREDLVAAIDADIGTAVNDDGGCVGDLVVDAVGSAEALNALGVTAEEPTFELVALGLGTSATDTLIQEIFACGSFVDRTAQRLSVAEPSYASCLVDTLSENELWRAAMVEVALAEGEPSYSAERRETVALDDCLEERLTEILGVEPDRFDLSTAKSFGEGMHASDVELYPGYEDYGYTQTDLECASYVLLREVSLNDWISTLTPVLEDPERVTQAEFEEILAMYLELAKASRACMSDFDFIAVDVSRAGFSPETLECVLEESGDIEELADRWEVGLYSDDLDTILEAESAYALIYDAVEKCHDDTEREVFEAWDDYLLGTDSDIDFGEPDSLST